MNCDICQAPFQPTNKKHRHCHNNCTAKLYAARKKVRLQIKEALKALRTPEQVNELNQSLSSLLGAN
jgi:hypothetical protein